MTEQAFVSVWELQYADFEFLIWYEAKSQIMLAYQVLFVRQHGRFPEDHNDLPQMLLNAFRTKLAWPTIRPTSFPARQPVAIAKVFSISLGEYAGDQNETARQLGVSLLGS